MRRFAWLLIVTLVLGVLSAAPANAMAPASTPDLRTSADGVPAARHRPDVSTNPAPRLDTDLVIPGPARRASGSRVRLWPTSRVLYYESIPAKWQWSLDDAIAHWNGTGARIKLVKTKSKSRARLLIGYGDTGGADGLGTLGYAWPYQKNFVRLSRAYRHVSANDPAQRAWVARLLAHEIGHNLGYSHVSRPRCALMQPVYLFGQCGPLSAGKPGYYQCRYIDPPLLRKHIVNYGGRAARPPTDCLLAPLPPALSDLKLTGGGPDTDSVVTLQWSVKRQPAGAQVTVASWPAATCTSRPARARSVTVPVTRHQWVDSDRASGHWCYSVQVANRWGAPRSAVRLDVTRIRRPIAAPTVGTWSFDPGRQVYRFSVGTAAGSELVVLRDALHPTTCITAYDENATYYPDQVAAGQYEIYPRAAAECLVFYAVADDGRHSDGVVRHVSVPEPPTPTIMSVTREDSGYVYAVEASGEGFTMRGVLVAGACPPSLPQEGAEYLYDDYLGYFYPATEGPHCLAVVTEDDYGRRSQPATQVLDVTFDQ